MTQLRDQVLEHEKAGLAASFDYVMSLPRTLMGLPTDEDARRRASEHYRAAAELRRRLWAENLPAADELAYYQEQP